MSGREWQPGDVAMVTSGDVRRADPAACAEFETVIGVRTGKAGGPGGWNQSDGYWIADDYVYEARPLIVIDPEDREQVERLLRGWYECDYSSQALLNKIPRMRAALREFANPTPPRFDEPGTWGVVEAACPHSDTRREWVHYPDGNWWPVFNYTTVPDRTPLPDDWSDLIDPVLVREGVTA